MKRKIIKIDEEKCNGCGLCIQGCAEGALAIVDGKAKLVSEKYCDGLGNCLGTCPQDAISIEERDAEEFDENLTAQHVEKLKTSNQQCSSAVPGGCPGSAARSFAPGVSGADSSCHGNIVSQLTHWPVQLHLINPMSDHFIGADLLLAADCSAFAAGNFHEKFLKGKTLAIACPKLDNSQQIYAEKLVALIDRARINTLSVITMEVPCCTGLLAIAKQAVEMSENKIPLKHTVLSLRGEEIKSEWIIH